MGANTIFSPARLLSSAWQPATSWNGPSSMAGLDAVYVFVLPPSWEVLAERLRARGSESASTQAQRLLVAHQELAHYTAYDYVVINDQMDEAVEILRAIILAERHRIRRVGTGPIALLLAPQQTKG